MATDRRGIGAEVATVALVAACLAGTLNLVISVHRKGLKPPEVARVVPPAASEPAPRPASEPAPVQVVEKPRPAPTPPAPVEDPTPGVVAGLAESTAKEREEAARLDREAAALEEGRKVVEAGAESWRRREMLVKQQLKTLDDKARATAREVDAYAAKRDVLAQERDALKAAIAAAPGEGSYAVLPYQGENGTWRRPIVIECSAGQVAILPDGPSFSLLELSGLANPRSSPVVVAIARELLKVKNSASPDGSPVVPYFVFLIRPDGVKSYYEARARLEPLGIAFGYELVDADMKVHVPNYDDVASWDGSPNLRVPSSALAGNGSSGGDGSGGDLPTGAWPNGGGGGGDKPGSGAGALAGGGLAWPGGEGTGTGTGSVGGPRSLAGAFDSPRGRGTGTGAGDDAGGDGPEAFVWSSKTPGAGRGGETDGPAGAEPDADGTTRDGTTPRGGLGVRPGGGIKPPARDIGRPDFARRGDSTGLDRPGAGPDAAGSRDPGGGLMWGEDAPVGVTPGVARGYRGGQLGTARPEAKPSATAAPDPVGEPPRELALDDAIAGALDPAPGAEPPAGFKPPEGFKPPPGVKPPAGFKPPAGALGSGMKPPPIGLGLTGGGARIPLGMGSSGGMPIPGLMLGADVESTKGGGAPDGGEPGEEGMGPLIPDRERKRPPAIEVPFEIVVACERDGVTIQPGNRRITSDALKNRRGEELLARNLEAEARRRAAVDPSIRPRPRVKFLVRDDGAANFWEARRQLLFSGLDWPMTLQVAGVQNPKLLDERGIW